MQGDAERNEGADRAARLAIDRDAIEQVIRNWALWRDGWNWPQLRACYTPDAVMHTTWFVGSAGEFVDRSMEAAKKGARSQHFIGAASIEVRGDRAIAETRMMLLLRAVLQGTEVDVTAYARFYDLFARLQDTWRIRKRVPIYEKDRLDPVTPGAIVALDPAELARYPGAYRHVAYIQASGGARVNPDLPTANSDVLERLYREGGDWLGGR